MRNEKGGKVHVASTCHVRRAFVLSRPDFRQTQAPSCYFQLFLIPLANTYNLLSMATVHCGRDFSLLLGRVTTMWHRTAVPYSSSRGYSLSFHMFHQSIHGRRVSKVSGGIENGEAPDDGTVEHGPRPRPTITKTEEAPSQWSEDETRIDSIADKMPHFHEATHQATHRVTEKVGFAVMERLVDRVLGRTGRAGGERGMERAAIKIGQHAAERLGERTAERVSEKAAEQLGEKVVEHAVAQAAQKAARNSFQASLQHLGERESAQIAKRSAEQVLSRVGEQEARIAEHGGGRVVKHIGSALQSHVLTRFGIDAGRLSERLILRFARGVAIALPALGSLFVMHLVREDRKRALQEAASGNSVAASRAFWLAFICDAADVGAHAMIVMGLLHNYFHIGVSMPHHALHVAEWGGLLAAVVSTVAAILGEILSAGMLKHKKAFGGR